MLPCSSHFHNLVDTMAPLKPISHRLHFKIILTNEEVLCLTTIMYIEMFLSELDLEQSFP